MSELKSISDRQQCENSHHLSARADGRTTMGERRQKGGERGMESTKLGQKLYPGIVLMGEARKGWSQASAI